MWPSALWLTYNCLMSSSLIHFCVMSLQASTRKWWKSGGPCTLAASSRCRSCTILAITSCHWQSWSISESECKSWHILPTFLLMDSIRTKLVNLILMAVYESTHLAQLRLCLKSWSWDRILMQCNEGMRLILWWGLRPESTKLGVESTKLPCASDLWIVSGNASEDSECRPRQASSKTQSCFLPVLDDVLAFSLSLPRRRSQLQDNDKQARLRYSSTYPYWLPWLWWLVSFLLVQPSGTLDKHNSGVAVYCYMSNSDKWQMLLHAKL